MAELLHVKTIRPAVNATRKYVDRFYREIRVLSELSHPHIVAFHQFDVLRRHFYLIMEYVEGTDAERVLSVEGPLSVSRAVAWVCQLLNALEYAHGRGFVHRDIEPANLLIAGKETASSSRSRILAWRRTCKTNQYTAALRDWATWAVRRGSCRRSRSPLTGKPGRPADKYAAAATLYNLLTDKYVHDFPASTSARLVMIMENDAVPIHTRRPELPPALAAVIHRALNPQLGPTLSRRSGFSAQVAAVCGRWAMNESVE